MSGLIFIKTIQYFIIFILLLEIISFLSGFGTHFETHKFYIIISVLIFNSFMVFIIKKLK
jgi:hypothetical protein